MKNLITSFFTFLVSLVVLCSSCFAGSTLSTEQAWQKIKAGATVVDVRSTEEFASGHLEGAINIPHDTIAQHLSELGSDKAKEIVLYCKSGRRAGIAQETLNTQGFTQVYNAGGYADLVNRENTSLSKPN